MTNDIIITMTKSKSCTATFTNKPQIITWNLDVTIIGPGSYSKSGTPTSCGAPDCWIYNDKDIITLTAINTPTSTFSAWSGNGCTILDPKDTTGATAIVMMDASK